MIEEIRCRRCKRLLHGKEARYIGMGPICARKNPALAAQLRNEAEGQMRLFAEKSAYPWTVQELQNAAKSGDWGKILLTNSEELDALKEKLLAPTWEDKK